jgi:hypothetical protein
MKSSPALLKVLKNAASQKQSKTDADGFYAMPHDEALAKINEFLKEDDPLAVPLDVIRAATSLLKDTSELNAALTSLVYTPPPPEKDKNSTEFKRFQKRMDRLRLRAEETRYKKLTNNLDNTIEDDVTTKSMTYATSVGLNMIVAPISFGVFMYFFAGQVFNWLGGSKPLGPHEVDIRRVIAGVISGVGMLFIEMILFVIRTHTMDKVMRKKAKKKSKSPFGYTKPAAPGATVTTATGIDSKGTTTTKEKPAVLGKKQ